MKFGPVPPARIAGAILAHSLTVNGQKLRKGIRLTEQHARLLSDAGLKQVIVAQLDPEDLHEDAAAQQLAAALAPDLRGLRLTAPFTGRVNILARGPGLALLDEARLIAANEVHPMITVATVPPHQQMAARGMVATVKIISYGVPRADLERACHLAHRAIRFAPPQLRTASLLITQIPGGAGEKGLPAIEARLNALNIALTEVITVPHQEQPLSAALAGVSSDLTLILTGSATSDPLDVAPQAVRLAGGRVERFGMPVDPGNLLFLADISGRPVIGLPGCARSPALNGADWVLGRVACALPVTGRDIARMGVGGLLKEIPTRPMPRQGHKPAPAQAPDRKDTSIEVPG
ncbi:MAG: molybdopterin biosynthesis protein [Rhodobacteraceae bacterium]|nr:molybdopterin biosynthesis protein [Paracoccaceae bacterium]MBT26391.1 molybdopterin biosynthesis protein [Paracoccaceae bacterium]